MDMPGYPHFAPALPVGPRVLPACLLWLACAAGCSRPPAPGTPDRRATEEGLTPLAAVEDALDRELPPGSVVLGARHADRVVGPMQVRVHETAVEGLALCLPQGEASAGKSGLATFSAELKQGGSYKLWIRGFWDDSCGNSVGVTVDDQPMRSVGQDALYGVWHWVPAGRYELQPGRRRIALREREDGVALDQLLLCPDPRFVPSGPVRRGASVFGIRRFADRFDRSPGHGSEGWDFVSGAWDITFTLDPNRIPLQYSLSCRPDGSEPALARIEGPPWRGCRIEFSAFPVGPGEFGVAWYEAGQTGRVTRLTVGTGEQGAFLRARGPGLREELALDGCIRGGEWHRMAVERWASVLRVELDGRTVFERFDAEPAFSVPALWAAGGRVAFDDVAANEIPWQAEFPGLARIPWRLSEGAEWYRADPGRTNAVLVGRTGEITASWAGLPVAEIAAEDVAPFAYPKPELFKAAAAGRWRLFRGDGGAGALLDRTVLRAGSGTVRAGRIAIRYGRPPANVYRLGPYSFSSSKVVDPSDYYDFTPQEIAAMQASTNADAVVRHTRHVDLLGRGEKACWLTDSGRWRIEGGSLLGRGPGARLRFWQEIRASVEVSLRVRFEAREDRAEVGLYGGGGRGVALRLAPGTGDAEVLGTGPPGAWRKVVLRSAGGRLVAACGESRREQPIPGGARGGALVLRVPHGVARFDDVEIVVRRHGSRGHYYAFDRRETDWWRGDVDGGARWVDHGGISCVLASSWISLLAQEGMGMLWNKRRFEDDLRVGCTVEENTIWYGWDREPSHVHCPQDNICVVLGDAPAFDRGYRLEVNARNRSATVLYRNGEEVASVPQTGNFPIRYHGGHMPYRPRRHHVALWRRGDTLRAVVNGREVLRFTDPDPLPGGVVGIGGYHTRMNFSHLEINPLTPLHAGRRPQPESPPPGRPMHSRTTG